MWLVFRCVSQLRTAHPVAVCQFDTDLVRQFGSYFPVSKTLYKVVSLHTGLLVPANRSLVAYRQRRCSVQPSTSFQSRIFCFVAVGRIVQAFFQDFGGLFALFSHTPPPDPDGGQGSRMCKPFFIEPPSRFLLFHARPPWRCASFRPRFAAPHARAVGTVRKLVCVVAQTGNLPQQVRHGVCRGAGGFLFPQIRERRYSSRENPLVLTCSQRWRYSRSFSRSGMT